MSLIPNAFAADVASATGAATTHASSAQSTFMSFLPMIVIFALFWFLLIRPQQKKTKLHNQMLSALSVGDEVVTSGGILGKIAKISDSVINLEVAANVVIQVQRSTVSGKINQAVATK